MAGAEEEEEGREDMQPLLPAPRALSGVLSGDDVPQLPERPDEALPPGLVPQQEDEHAEPPGSPFLLPPEQDYASTASNGGVGQTRGVAGSNVGSAQTDAARSQQSAAAGVSLGTPFQRVGSSEVEQPGAEPASAETMLSRQNSSEGHNGMASCRMSRQGSGAAKLLQSLHLKGRRRSSGGPAAATTLATPTKKLWGAVKRAAATEVAANGGGLHRKTASMSKNALSAVTSTLLGGGPGGGAARPLRLADVEGREEWGAAEKLQRALFLPAVRESFDTLCAGPGGFREFGLAFYRLLFDSGGDSLRDDVFGGESLEVLALKLRSATGEMIRIAGLERPSEVASVVVELGLTHLEYGVKEAHLEPYKAAMLAALRRVIVGRGAKWSRTQGRAWAWMLDLLSGLMLETMQRAGPLVATLRTSWVGLCEALHADSLAPAPRIGQLLLQTQPSFMQRASVGRLSMSFSNNKHSGAGASDKRRLSVAVPGDVERELEGAPDRPMLSPLASLPREYASPGGSSSSGAEGQANGHGSSRSSRVLPLPTSFPSGAGPPTANLSASSNRVRVPSSSRSKLEDHDEISATTAPPAHGRPGDSGSISQQQSMKESSLLPIASSTSRSLGTALERVTETLTGRGSSPGTSSRGKTRATSTTGDESPKLIAAASDSTAAPANNLLGISGVTQRVDAVRTKLKSMVTKKHPRLDEGVSLPLWSVKGGRQGGANDPRIDSPEYREGRRLAGRALLSVLGSSEPELRVTLLSANGRSEALAEEALGHGLELVVACATRPHLLRDKLRVLAVRYAAAGVGVDVLDTAGDVLFAYLPLVMGSGGLWDEQTEAAWHWIWGIVHDALRRYMQRSGRLVEVIAASWGLLQDAGAGEALATDFYRRMFATAGAKMQHLFARPEKMQHAMFHCALNMLVEAMQRPDSMQAEIESIAMRHIKYDITREHIDIFGAMLQDTIKDALLQQGKEHWNEEVAAAWADTYSFTAEVFLRVIGAGSSNLVSRALAGGDASALGVALSHSARSKRAAAAVEIRAVEATISPLLWTIRDGKLAMTEVLLRDTLAIRGDRSKYYCGRALLWEKHPGLVRLLVEKAPRLLGVLLDGHLWTSRFIENGCRRANFYIAELYGNPSNPETAAVASSMLGMFVYRLPMTELHLFTHPVTTFIVDLKWRLFARRSFFTMQALNVANLCFATAYLQVGASSPAASLGLALVQVLCAVVRLLMYVRPVLRQLRTHGGIRVIVPLLRVPLRVPPVFQDTFVILNLLSGALCITLFVYTWLADPFGWNRVLGAPERTSHDLLQTWATVTAFTTGLLWIQVAELLKASTKLSALYYAMMAVIGDVIRFLMVLGLWATGFAFTLYWLVVAQYLHEGADMEEALAVGVETGEGAGNLVYFMLMAFLGLAGLEEAMLSSWLIRVLFAACIITSVVVLLNLLISTMVSTYDLLQRSCNELAVKSLAQLVVRAEESLPLERRVAIYERLGLDEPVEFDANDSGPSGGVQVKLPVDQLQHPAYKVLDRVERYAGSTDPRAVWAPADLTSAAVVEDSAEASGMHACMAGQLGDAEARITAKLLLELDAIKSALGVNGSDSDEGAGEEGGANGAEE